MYKILMALFLTFMVHEAMAAPPNIVLFYIDDLGYGYDIPMSQGGVATPNIKSIATNGINFQNAITAPTCAPSRGGLLTGRVSAEWGLRTNPTGLSGASLDLFGLSSSEITLPQRLKGIGYSTFMAGKWHLGNTVDRNPTKKGFDKFIGVIDSDYPYISGDLTNPLLDGFKKIPQVGWMTDMMANVTVDYINRNKDKPFFLYLPFTAVHTPYAAKPETISKLTYIPAGPRRQYAGVLTELDQAVGKILKALNTNGIADNTMVIFMGDNGPAGSAPKSKLKGRKGTLYEGGGRVPLYISWPGHFKPGQKYNYTVSNTDLYPTIMAAAKGSSPSTVKGVNLLPNIANNTSPNRDLYMIAGGKGAYIRRGNWKLLENVDKIPYQLYNLATDPYETKNVAANNPTIVTTLHAALAKLIDKLPPAQF